MSTLQYSPKFTLDQAADLAAQFFGIRATTQPLPSERDQNFLLTAEDGSKYVLKISNASDDRNLLDAQNQVLMHLSKHTDLCPKVVLSKNGEPLVKISHQEITHFLRLVHYLPGVAMGTVQNHSKALLHDLGRAIGTLDHALTDFDHAALHRNFYWDLANGSQIIKQYEAFIDDPLLRTIVLKIAEEFEHSTLPLLAGHRRSIIHNDANDYNVIVGGGSDPFTRYQRVVGILDFGDMVYSYTVCNLAIAIAYAILNKPDPLESATAVIRGYAETFSLTEAEVASLFGLIQLRYAMSICIAAYQQKQRPSDDYLSISQQSIRKALPELSKIHPRFAEAKFRTASGSPAMKQTRAISDWLEKTKASPVLELDLRNERFIVFDLSVSSPLLHGNPVENEEPQLTPRLHTEMKQAGVRVGIGRYGEARYLYTSPAFGSTDALQERRTVHLGIDLFADAGTKVFAPFASEVHAFSNNAAPQDYGPVIILKHATDEGSIFYTLYGHLSVESLKDLHIGKKISAGESIGSIGTADINGGWTPHLHLQVITDLLDLDCDFPGVCRASEHEIWFEFSPDPNLILKLPTLSRSADTRASDTLKVRREIIGTNVRLSYRSPVKIVRGWMQYLFDEDGKRYIDAYNNVPHVGHCHPRVIKAALDQMTVLSTNTRYLHDLINRYSEKLCSTLPEPLRVCYFVNSGSEANELAVRLARAFTKQRDMIVLDAAYHGITSTLIDLSPYKHLGPGGEGTPDWVHVAPLADPYRSRKTVSESVQDISQILQRIKKQGKSLAALLAESCPSVGGQILFAQGYLSNVYRLVREAGGLCIADEVQTGYGRIGTHFWGFESQNVVPDIVVLGKPIGNGHPIGAVVTTKEIAAAFDNGMEFFSTFGGNTVSCAIGLSVLEVVLEEQLQQHAYTVGSSLLQQLQQLQQRHLIIGDVRGSGFFLGVELVHNRKTLEPATEEASYVVDRMRELGILLGTDGPFHNVLKIRPPMPFSQEDATVFVDALDPVLAELK